jgi:hypothetical protein
LQIIGARSEKQEREERERERERGRRISRRKYQRLIGGPSEAESAARSVWPELPDTINTDELTLYMLHLYTCYVYIAAVWVGKVKDQIKREQLSFDYGAGYPGVATKRS